MKLAQAVSYYFCDISKLCEARVGHIVLSTVILWHLERYIDTSTV